MHNFNNWIEKKWYKIFWGRWLYGVVGAKGGGGDFLPILFFVNRFMYTMLQVQIHYIDILLLAIMYIYNMSVDFIL